MSRVKLSEFRAKSILYNATGRIYDGVSIDVQKFSTKDVEEFFSHYEVAVLKVDQAIKQRNKVGLVKLDVSASNIEQYVKEFARAGFTSLLLEPFIAHKQTSEKYLSIELTDSGVLIMYSNVGGVNIENHKNQVKYYEINSDSQINDISIPEIDYKVLTQILKVFHQQHMTNLEINPYVIIRKKMIFLDAAIQVDGSAEFFSSLWSNNDIRLSEKQSYDAEKSVALLAATSPASLSLRVLNKNGAIFMLLSGGGASVVLLDEIAAAGHIADVANYGEYSGNPSRQETYLYTKQVLSLLNESSADRKVLLIAGGVANFTDVKTTFDGIIDAMKEFRTILSKPSVKVIIRRGGPNAEEGLAYIKEFLDEASIDNIVYGADTPLTRAVDNTIQSLEGTQT